MESSPTISIPASPTPNAVIVAATPITAATPTPVAGIAGAARRTQSARKSNKPPKETIDEFLCRFRRPSLTEISYSLISEGSIISDLDPNNINLNQMQQGSYASTDTFGYIDSTVSYDMCEDVDFAKDRIESKRQQFKEKFVPQENKEFDFSQLSKEETRQQIVDYKLRLKADRERVVHRRWKQTAETLKPRLEDQVRTAKKSAKAQLQNWSDNKNYEPQSEMSPSQIKSGFSKNFTIDSVFGHRAREVDDDEEDHSFHRRQRRHHHHHHKHRRRSSARDSGGRSPGRLASGASAAYFSESEESIPSYSATDSETDSELDRMTEYEMKMHSQSTTVPAEVAIEQAKIIAAIDEWADLKERNYSGRHYDVVNKMKASLIVAKGESTFSHHSTQDDIILLSEIADASFLQQESSSLETFQGGDGSYEFVRLESTTSRGPGSRLQDIIIDAIHEDNVPYQKLGLDDKNYFGEAAKLRFFGKFQQVRANRHKKTTSSRVVGDKTVFEMDSTRLALLSPRTRFLTRYVSLFESPPLPIVVRLNPKSTELDLSDMQLGDNYIMLLSEVLNELPRVSIVNVRNNHLTDKSIQPLIETLSNQTHITELDLSNNKVDEKSALALEDMIKAKTCPLRCLKLGKADISDEELAMFSAAFEVNKSITQLDVSGNILGASESRNDYGAISFGNLLISDGHLPTAGKSIASALMKNKGIQHLDLSWNKLAALSASHLSTALSASTSVTHVNISYNNIRDVGAEALASALFDNSSIRSLDVSYNGITAEGCIYFAASLKANSVLENFNISGNPIGDLGGIALIHCINYQSVKREMAIHSCTYPQVNSLDEKFPRLLFPSRRFVLNMKLLRDRVVAIELFRLGSMRRGYVFKRIEHVSVDRKGVAKKKTVVLQRPQNPAEHMGHAYGVWTSASHRSQHPYCHLSADDWMSVIARLELVDANTGWPWQIPHAGTLTIDFAYYPRVPCPIDCLNATGLKRLIIMLSHHRKTMVDLLRLCTQSIMIESEQLAEIMRDLSSAIFADQKGDNMHFKSQELLEVFIRLLPCVRDTCNVDSLIQQHFPVRSTVRDIQLNLRSMYFVLVGGICGHFKLDLGDSLDRQCAIRLAEIDAEENFCMSELMPQWAENKAHSFTAQTKSVRTNFRNAMFRSAKIVLTDDFFKNGLEDHGPGVLEFDYVSTVRPAADVKVVTDSDLNGLLVARGLRDRVFGTQAAMDPAMLSHMEDGHVTAASGSNDDDNSSVVSMSSRKTARRSGVSLGTMGGGGGGGGGVGGGGGGGASGSSADDNPLISGRRGSGVAAASQSSKSSSKSPPKSVMMMSSKNASGKGMLTSRPGAMSGRMKGLLSVSTERDEEDGDRSDSASEVDNLNVPLGGGLRRNAVVAVQESHPLTFGGLQQVSRAASTFLRKFRQMKARLGSWLAHDKYKTPEALMESLHVHGEYLTKPLTMDGVGLIHREVVKQDALYYAGDSLHRFVVRISIRIHSKDCRQVSKSKAIAQQQLEFMQSQAFKRKHTKKKVAAKSGKSISDGNVHAVHDHDTSEVDLPFELQYYGSLMEACCVYRIGQDGDTGEVQYKHTGQHPYSSFVAHQPLETIPYVRLKPCTLQQGMRSDPTHRRFKLYEDVSINGTEIVIRVRCTHWSSMRKIQDYAKGFLNKIFPAFRIRPGDINTTSTSSCEMDDDIFLDPKMPKSVITHVVQHQMDVTIEPIPFLKRSILKVQVATTDVGGMQSMASVIFGRTTSNAKDKDGNTPAKSTKDTTTTPGRSGKTFEGFGRNPSISQKDSPNSSTKLTPIHPDAGKMFVVWRWRDIENGDRFICASILSNIDAAHANVF
jgi:Ran GTPase-activating protein (RanGAP) involved in mRNA processing and transport